MAQNNNKVLNKNIKEVWTCSLIALQITTKPIT